MKHTKLFYRAVARIREVNEKYRVVYLDRLQTKFRISHPRALRLREEMVKAGVIREWTDNDLKAISRCRFVGGNVLWKNLHKFKVPKSITKRERYLIEEERKKGLFPPKTRELNWKALFKRDFGVDLPISRTSGTSIEEALKINKNYKNWVDVEFTCLRLMGYGLGTRLILTEQNLIHKDKKYFDEIVYKIKEYEDKNYRLYFDVSNHMHRFNINPNETAWPDSSLKKFI